MASVPNPLTDYERGLINRGVPELTLKDVSAINQYVPHLRAGTPEGDALVDKELPNGKQFKGPAWQWEQEVQRLEYLAGWDRMLVTTGDIEGGLGGVVGFALDGARGAAAGAKLVDEPINSLDPHDPLNRKGGVNAPENYVHGAPTHESYSSSSPPVGEKHIQMPSAQRGAHAPKEPPPTSDVHAADEVRGLQNRLGVAPPGVQSPKQRPSKVRIPPGLVERQRRPVGPVSPSPSRGYRGSIEGPLLVLPSKRRVFTQERTTRLAPLPPAVVPAVKAPPNRTVRPNTTRSKVKRTDRPRNEPSLGAASTTGKAVRGKGLDDRGVPVATALKGEPGQQGLTTDPGAQAAGGTRSNATIPKAADSKATLPGNKSLTTIASAQVPTAPVARNPIEEYLARGGEIKRPPIDPATGKPKVGGTRPRQITTPRDQSWEGLLGEGLEERSIQTGTRSYTGMAEAPEHHILPKESKYRAWFEKRGIGRNEIHKVTVKLPKWEHEAIHGGGDWQKARKQWEGEWNRNMMDNLYDAEREKGSLLTTREIWDIAYKQVRKYNLPREFVPYSGPWN